MYKIQKCSNFFEVILLRVYVCVVSYKTAGMGTNYQEKNTKCL